MAIFNPYLNFNGNTEEAFNFYKSVFGGEFTGFQRLKDTPNADKIPKEALNMIMHIALPIGNGNTLMGTDAPELMGFHIIEGNNFYISINTESKEESDEIYNKLSVGARNIEMPLGDAFWGAYYACFTDKFGIQWMINFEYKR